MITKNLKTLILIGPENGGAYTRAIKQGLKQLETYKKELESMPEFKGIQWKTVLDTY